MMLNLKELKAISDLMDIGVRSMGISICEGGGAAVVQSAFDKLEAMAVAAKAAEAPAPANAAPEPKPEA